MLKRVESMCDSVANLEKELTGREEEPSELIYFKVYKSQIPDTAQLDLTVLQVLARPIRVAIVQVRASEKVGADHLQTATAGFVRVQHQSCRLACPLDE
jgi:hypothetical protein